MHRSRGAPRGPRVSRGGMRGSSSRGKLKCNLKALIVQRKNKDNFSQLHLLIFTYFLLKTTMMIQEMGSPFIRGCHLVALRHWREDRQSEMEVHHPRDQPPLVQWADVSMTFWRGFCSCRLYFCGSFQMLKVFRIDFVIVIICFSSNVKGQGSLWATTSERLDVQEGRLPFTKRWSLQL